MNNGGSSLYFRLYFFRKVIANFNPHPSPLGTLRACGRLSCEDWHRDCKRCYLRLTQPSEQMSVRKNCAEWPLCGGCSLSQTPGCPCFWVNVVRIEPDEDLGSTGDHDLLQD